MSSSVYISKLLFILLQITQHKGNTPKIHYSIITNYVNLGPPQIKMTYFIAKLRSKRSILCILLILKYIYSILGLHLWSGVSRITSTSPVQQLFRLRCCDSESDFSEWPSNFLTISRYFYSLVSLKRLLEVVFLLLHHVTCIESNQNCHLQVEIKSCLKWTVASPDRICQLVTQLVSTEMLQAAKRAL